MHPRPTSISCGESNAPTAGIGLGNVTQNSNCAGVDCESNNSIGLGVSISFDGQQSESLDMRDQNLRNERQGQMVIFVKGNLPLDGLNKNGFDILQQHRLETIGSQMVKIRLPRGINFAQATSALQGIDGVQSLQPNYVYEAKNGVNSGLEVIGSNPQSGLRATGTIAIIDGMVDKNHNDLRSARISQRRIASRPEATKHGTAIASLLVGSGRVKGVAQGANILSYAAIQIENNRHFLGETVWIAEAFDEAAQSSASVISMSLGIYNVDQIVKQLLDVAAQRGKLIVAAIGNSGGSSVTYPAGYASVVGITTVDGNQRLYSNATRGAHVSYASLGVNLVVATPNSYDTASGTSMATALFAGTLLGIANETATSVRGAINRIDAHLVDLRPQGNDASFGKGLLVR